MCSEDRAHLRPNLSTQVCTELFSWVAASSRLVIYSQDGHCPKGCVQSAHSRVTLDMQGKLALCPFFSILRPCES